MEATKPASRDEVLVVLVAAFSEMTTGVSDGQGIPWTVDGSDRFPKGLYVRVQGGAKRSSLATC